MTTSVAVHLMLSTVLLRHEKTSYMDFLVCLDYFLFLVHFPREETANIFL